MSVRAKFRCVVVEDYGQSKKVKLNVVYQSGPALSAEQKENQRFTKATPNGELWMTVDNPDASIQFKPGACYYLDFTEAPEYD